MQSSPDRRRLRLVPQVLLGGCLALASLASQAQNLRVMPVGDSITSGFQSSDNNGYRGALHAALVAETSSLDFVGSVKDGSMADRDHEGHSGWRIDEIATIITNRLQRYRPNVVTLHIGTNDMGQNHQVAGAPTRLASLIDQIFSAAPDASIVVASLIHARNPDVESRVLAYNAQIRGIVQARANAGKHIFMVDMSSVDVADLRDDLHPNDGGYRKMAAVWNEGIRHVIAQGWVPAPVPIATRLIGQQSARCVDLPGGSQADNTRVHLWDCNGGANQSFTLQANGTLSVYGNKCLDVLGQDTRPGAVVGLYGCNGGTNQQWQFRPDGAIVSAQSGLCLDVAGQATTNGSAVALWNCNGGANQKWTRGD
jgi:lysophospholipase L1-like esterase